MNNSLYDKLHGELSDSFRRYATLRGHFEKFCKHAEWLAGPETGIEIKVSRNGDALMLEFLDRRVRVSMRFDRKAKKGILHAEDVSAERRDEKPISVKRIAFDDRSETELAGDKPGDKLRLNIQNDAIALALLIVDAALDQDPWN